MNHSLIQPKRRSKPAPIRIVLAPPSSEATAELVRAYGRISELEQTLAQIERDELCSVGLASVGISIGRSTVHTRTSTGPALPANNKFDDAIAALRVLGVKQADAERRVELVGNKATVEEIVKACLKGAK